MTRRSLVLAPLLAIAMLASPIASIARAAPRTPFRCPPAWSFVPYVPGPGAPATSPLTVVSGSAPGDVWGVGSALGAPILHFDGATWSAPPQPSLQSSLRSVAAVSATDAWAVGSLAKAHGSRTLVLHWNGARWSRVTDAAGTVRDGTLRRVVADGPDDVWAVGSVTDTLGASRGFVERWDGAAWTETPVASASDVSPQDISAVAPDDAWMVGGIAGGGTMAQHFDGTAWTIVPTPNVGIYTSVLASVTAIDTSDVWAAGQSGRHHNPPLIEHWNGFAWSVVSTDGTHETTLVSLHADSPDDVWAVGPSVHVGTLIEHWNGVSWSRVWQIPTRGRPVSLGMLGSAGPGELWAGAGARICPIVLSDTGMSPRYADTTSPITIRAVRVPRLIPKTVAWRVDPYATEPSTIREVSIGLFDSGPLLPGDSFTYTFEAAGTYSIVHLPSEKVGTVGIPLRVRPSHGSVTQVFHLWWGGGVEDVQVKPPRSSRFITWRSQTFDDFGDFGPTDPLWAGPGDYVFRARLRDRDTHGITDWSPESTVHVR